MLTGPVVGHQQNGASPCFFPITDRSTAPISLHLFLFWCLSLADSYIVAGTWTEILNNQPDCCVNIYTLF